MNDKKDDAISVTDSTMHIKQNETAMEIHSTAVVKENSLDMQDLSIETINSSSQRTIVEITAEIIHHKCEIAKSFIEIGWLLIEAKERLSGGHGHWLKWLSESVDISERMAQRYMQLAKAYTNTSLMSDLGITKALVLLVLPEDEREAFINEYHEVNGKQKKVTEMSTQEIKKAIRKKKETDGKYDESASLESFSLNLKSVLKYLDGMVDFLEKERENSSIQERFLSELYSIRNKTARCIFLASSNRNKIRKRSEN